MFSELSRFATSIERRLWIFEMSFVLELLTAIRFKLRWYRKVERMLIFCCVLNIWFLFLVVFVGLAGVPFVVVFAHCLPAFFFPLELFLIFLTHLTILHPRWFLLLLLLLYPFWNVLTTAFLERD